MIFRLSTGKWSRSLPKANTTARKRLNPHRPAGAAGMHTVAPVRSTISSPTDGSPPPMPRPVIYDLALSRSTDKSERGLNEIFVDFQKHHNVPRREPLPQII